MSFKCSKARLRAAIHAVLLAKKLCGPSLSAAESSLRLQLETTPRVLRTRNRPEHDTSKLTVADSSSGVTECNATASGTLSLALLRARTCLCSQATNTTAFSVRLCRIAVDFQGSAALFCKRAGRWHSRPVTPLRLCDSQNKTSEKGFKRFYEQVQEYKADESRQSQMWLGCMVFLPDAPQCRQVA